MASYLGKSSGRLLVIAEDDLLVPIAKRQGFETALLSANDPDFSAQFPADLDACILFCTLEKLSDPLSLLESIRQAMPPGGALMVVAAVRNESREQVSQSSWQELNRGNRFYFTVDTLQCLLLKAGFGDPIIASDARLAGSSEAPADSDARISFLVRPKTPRAKPLLSVIVPAFNEKGTFTSMMDQLLQKTLDGVDIEIVIVESNSTDGTREEVSKYGYHPRVRIIFEPKAQGKGHAVRAGLEIARGDIILFQDADLEYDLNDYDALIAPLLRYESNFVLGSRHDDSKTAWKIRQFTDSAALAAYLNLGHVLFLWMFNVLYKQRLTDPFTMYKVFRRDCLYGLRFECNRFDFDNEIVIKLVRKGYRPLELPVNYVSRSFAEGKKVTLVGDGIRLFKTMFQFRKTPLYTTPAQS
ncbi:MAG: glycosyltransferase [Acidobacteriaceae bacterium]|nr:glycosyltransferase [Acidobacteriaceae bacterium]